MVPNEITLSYFYTKIENFFVKSTYVLLTSYFYYPFLPFTTLEIFALTLYAVYFPHYHASL